MTEKKENRAEKRDGVPRQIRSAVLRPGMLPAAVMDRSVERPARQACPGQASSGQDRHFSDPDKNTAAAEPAVSSGIIGGSFDKPLEEILAESVNCITARKAQTAGLMLSVFLPRNTPETDLYELFKRAASFCSSLQISLKPGEILVTDALLRPAVSAAAYADRLLPAPGVADKMLPAPIVSLESGLEVWMLGWAGAAGGTRLVSGMHEELAGHFNERFLKEAADWGKHRLIGYGESGKRDLLFSDDVRMILPAGNGGIYKALWDLGELFQSGMEIAIRTVPIRQETIEVCEYLDVDPYRLDSCGAALVVVKDGEDKMLRLYESGMPCVRIGTLTPEKKRILLNHGEVRYLDKPVSDSLDELQERMITI